MKKYEIPEWLAKLQENSWELELFVSGGAIFSLFKASNYVMSVSENLSMTIALPGQGFIVVLVMLGLKLLTFGFVFHLLLRALWVSMVFINYVYPQGVNKHKIKWRKPFKIDIDERSDLYNPIMKIDRLSGIVMFLSIVSSFAIIGFVFMMSFFMFITFSGILPVFIDRRFIPFILLFTLVYLVDLISFGVLRKIPLLSYITFPVFKLFDFLSLRFIYAKPLLVYSTNVNKVKSSLVISGFILISFLSAYVSVRAYFHWPNVLDNREYKWQMADNDFIGTFYEDINPNSRLTIPSKIIKNNFLELRIIYWAEDNRFMKLIDKPEDERLFSNIIEVSIDDSVYSELNWYPFKNMDDRYGILAMIPIESLKSGEHLIVVKNTPEIIEKAKVNRYYTPIIEIPFWKN